MTSPDGITWTSRSAAAANQWNAVTFGNGLFVAVSDSGTDRVYDHPQTASLGPPHKRSTTWQAVAYGNGVFAAVASGGANRVMTSPAASTALQVNGTSYLGDTQTGNITTKNITVTGTSFLAGIQVTGAQSLKSDSAAALAIQNSAGTSIMTANGATGEVLFGQASSTAGVIAFANGTNANLIKVTAGVTTTAYTLTWPVAGATGTQCLQSTSGSTSSATSLQWGSCGGGGGGSTRTVRMVPEYQGGVLHADGTNNTGTILSDYVSGLASGEGYKHNYYEWMSTSGSAQDYDIIVNASIPSDYVSTLAGLKIWTYSSNLTNATATIQFQDNAGTNCYGSPVSITPGSTTTWTQITVGAMSGCTFAADDVVTITIHVVSQSSAVFRVGEVSIHLY